MVADAKKYFRCHCKYSRMLLGLCMRRLYHILFTLACCFILTMPAFAQNTAKQLIEEGIKLHDEGKYDDAIAKYQAALQQEPDNRTATYEMAFTLSTQKKYKEVINLLEALLKKVNNSPEGGIYDLLASCYDDIGKPEKAISTYMAGIKNDPEYQRLYFNLGITYNRLNKYPEAEKWAAEAVKREPSHASSQRLYAELATKQGRKIEGIMAYCYFLMLEPNTERAAANFKNVAQMVHGGAVLTGDKSVTINISADQLKRGTDDLLLSTSAANVMGKKLAPADELTELLTFVFNFAGEHAEKSSGESLYKSYATFFGNLTKAGHVPVLARYISLSSEMSNENQEWFKAHDNELKAFGTWVDAQQQVF